MGKMVLTVLSMVAEMELGFIKARQRDGIEWAKSKGDVYKGRKSAAEMLHCADFAIGRLTPGGMGYFGGEEIAARFARCFRNAAAEFAAFAILADIAADWEVPVCAPERLEQAGGGPKPRVEWLVDMVFLEDVGRDERQLVDGFPNSGAMLRPPMDTKPIQVTAAEIYSVRKAYREVPASRFSA